MIQEFLKGGGFRVPKKVRRNFQTEKQKQKKKIPMRNSGSPKSRVHRNFQTDKQKKPRGGVQGLRKGRSVGILQGGGDNPATPGWFSLFSLKLVHV